MHVRQPIPDDAPMPYENGDVPRYCPTCKVDTQDKPIPEESRQRYGDKTHFSKWCGIDINDRIATWVCPNGCRFKR